MKKYLAFFFLIPFLAQGQSSSKPFTLNGKLKKGMEHVEWVRFSYRANGARISDSARVHKGKYKYEGTLNEPTLVTITPGYKVDANGERPELVYERDYMYVFAEAGKQRLVSHDSLSNVTVKSSRVHKEYAKMEKAVKPFETQINALADQWRAKSPDDTEGRDAISAQIDEIDNQAREKKAEIFKSNPSSPLAVYLLKEYAGWDINAEKVEPLYDMLPASAKTLPSAMSLKEAVEIAKKTGIGMAAMDFTQADTLGRPVSLSSFRGSYVLVDFWASWCGPCRVENPNVVKAYNKYRGKGFNIIGVSLDREGQKERWLKAIADDHLNWTHVSDLKFWENAVAVMYGVKAIPQNFLIDPQGKIIAKNLRGEELDKRLEELIRPDKTF